MLYKIVGWCVGCKRWHILGKSFDDLNDAYQYINKSILPSGSGYGYSIVRVIEIDVDVETLLKPD